MNRFSLIMSPEGFAQVAFIGFFAFRDSVNPCIRGETVCDGLQHSPLVFGSHPRTLHPFPHEGYCLHLQNKTGPGVETRDLGLGDPHEDSCLHLQNKTGFGVDTRYLVGCGDGHEAYCLHLQNKTSLDVDARYLVGCGDGHETSCLPLQNKTGLGVDDRDLVGLGDDHEASCLHLEIQWRTRPVLVWMTTTLDLVMFVKLTVSTSRTTSSSDNLLSSLDRRRTTSCHENFFFKRSENRELFIKKE